jgi:hypothetical protein
VQAVCDSRLKFLNIVAKWPGGAHDSSCNGSSLRDLFENGTISDGWLLGDSAFSHFHQCEIDLAHVRQACEIFLSHTATTSFDCDVTYFYDLRYTVK